MPDVLTDRYVADYGQKKVKIYEKVPNDEGRNEPVLRWTVDPLTLVVYKPFQTGHTIPAFFLVYKGAAKKAVREPFFHRINQEEINLVKEILGIDADPDIKIVFLEHFRDRALSLPFKFLILDRYYVPIMSSTNNKAVFIHEYFHQIEYNTMPASAKKLFFELFKTESETYNQGDYIEKPEILQYDSIDQIIPLEGKARFVERFTQLYFNTRSKTEQRFAALYAHARILENSGFDSYAINKVLSWE
jgi:hypothetical protein